MATNVPPTAQDGKAPPLLAGPALRKNRKSFLPLMPLILCLLLGCGSFAANPPPLSQGEILATADAIRARTPVVPPGSTRDPCEPPLDEQTMTDCLADAKVKAIQNEVATDDAVIRMEMANDQATEMAEQATAEQVESDHYATLEAATEEAEFEATMEVVDATDVAAMATYEGGRTDCKGGCVDFPTWCKTVIKGNVSFDGDERIYHMPDDEYYDKTVINPRYGERYFCTPEEAEAAGFRHARN